MLRSHSTTKHSIRFLFSLTLLVVVSASVPAQEPNVEQRPLLDLTGNKVFSKAELLGVVNSQLDIWAKAGSKYEAPMLDYCLHQMDNYMKSRGYLQAKVTKGDLEQTEAGPSLMLTVMEGPLYRVRNVTVDGARLLTAEQVINETGLKPGEIASGGKLSEGLYQRLKARYANLGHIQYTAEVTPTFHAEIGDAEGVVDFALTVDEGDQFRIHSIKVVAADLSSTDLLNRELLLRDGDIFDDELFRESIKRMNRTGLVEPIDDEKDVQFTDLQEKQRQLAHKRGSTDDEITAPPLLDVVINVKKVTSRSSGRN